MFKPGLTRAILASTIGAIVGAVLTYSIRSSQNIEPFWDPLPIIVAIVAISPIAFLWGMGFFNQDSNFKPGLTRAIPASIIGATISAIVTLLLRSAQQMDPLWDPTPAFVLMAIIVPTMFLWGMGGFNPAMSTHPHPPGDDDHDDAHDDHAEEEPTTFALLMSQVWNVAGGAIILMVILFAIATANTGLRLDIANEADASFSEVGFSEWTIPFTDTVVELSQFTVFLGFIGFTVLSLAIVAGGLGFLFFFLNSGVTEVSEEG